MTVEVRDAAGCRRYRQGIDDTVVAAVTAGRRVICQRRLRMHASFIDQPERTSCERSLTESKGLTLSASWRARRSGALVIGTEGGQRRARLVAVDVVGGRRGEVDTSREKNSTWCT